MRELGKDFFLDRIIEVIHDHPLCLLHGPRKGLAHVTGPSDAIESHKVIVDQRIRHDAKLSQVLDEGQRFRFCPLLDKVGGANGYANADQAVGLDDIQK
jgi:hypothetical protein